MYKNLLDIIRLMYFPHDAKKQNKPVFKYTFTV